MAAWGDPLAATRAPVQPRPGAGANDAGANTLPELERRLLVNRTAVLETVERLRRRVRQDIRELSPLEQAQRRPGAALAVAAVAGLIAGRIAGGVLAMLL